MAWSPWRVLCLFLLLLCGTRAHNGPEGDKSDLQTGQLLLRRAEFEECPVGQFHTGTRCVECSLSCPPGFRVTSPCSATVDLSCESCSTALPDNAFWATSGFLDENGTSVACSWLCDAGFEERRLPNVSTTECVPCPKFTSYNTSCPPGYFREVPKCGYATSYVNASATELNRDVTMSDFCSRTCHKLEMLFSGQSRDIGSVLECECAQRAEETKCEDHGAVVAKGYSYCLGRNSTYHAAFKLLPNQYLAEAVDVGPFSFDMCRASCLHDPACSCFGPTSHINVVQGNMSAAAQRCYHAAKPCKVVAHPAAEHQVAVLIQSECVQCPETATTDPQGNNTCLCPAGSYMAVWRGDGYCMQCANVENGHWVHKGAVSLTGNFEDAYTRCPIVCNDGYYRTHWNVCSPASNLSPWFWVLYAMIWSIVLLSVAVKVVVFKLLDGKTCVSCWPFRKHAMCTGDIIKRLEGNVFNWLNYRLPLVSLALAAVWSGLILAHPEPFAVLFGLGYTLELRDRYETYQRDRTAVIAGSILLGCCFLSTIVLQLVMCCRLTNGSFMRCCKCSSKLGKRTLCKGCVLARRLHRFTSLHGRVAVGDDSFLESVFPKLGPPVRLSYGNCNMLLEPGTLVAWPPPSVGFGRCQNIYVCLNQSSHMEHTRFCLAEGQRLPTGVHLNPQSGVISGSVTVNSVKETDDGSAVGSVTIVAANPVGMCHCTVQFGPKRPPSGLRYNGFVVYSPQRGPLGIFTCDECLQDLSGERWQCESCDSFCLCDRCYAEFVCFRDIHQLDHNFVKASNCQSLNYTLHVGSRVCLCPEPGLDTGYPNGIFSVGGSGILPDGLQLNPHTGEVQGVLGIDALRRQKVTILLGQDGCVSCTADIVLAASTVPFVSGGTISYPAANGDRISWRNQCAKEESSHAFRVGEEFELLPLVAPENQVFSIEPELPRGVHFDSSTGRIFGKVLIPVERPTVFTVSGIMPSAELSGRTGPTGELRSDRRPSSAPQLRERPSVDRTAPQLSSVSTSTTLKLLFPARVATGPVREAFSSSVEYDLSSLSQNAHVISAEMVPVWIPIAQPFEFESVSVAPRLPPGLYIECNGAICGTPAMNWPRTEYELKFNLGRHSESLCVARISFAVDLWSKSWADEVAQLAPDAFEWQRHESAAEVADTDGCAHAMLLCVLSEVYRALGEHGQAIEVGNRAARIGAPKHKILAFDGVGRSFSALHWFAEAENANEQVKETLSEPPSCDDEVLMAHASTVQVRFEAITNLAFLERNVSESLRPWESETWGRQGQERNFGTRANLWETRQTKDFLKEKEKHDTSSSPRGSNCRDTPWDTECRCFDDRFEEQKTRYSQTLLTTRWHWEGGGDTPLNLETVLTVYEKLGQWFAASKQFSKSRDMNEKFTRLWNSCQDWQHQGVWSEVYLDMFTDRFAAIERLAGLEVRLNKAQEAGDAEWEVEALEAEYNAVLETFMSMPARSEVAAAASHPSELSGDMTNQHLSEERSGEQSWASPTRANAPTLEGYDFDRPTGEGAQGTVWRATDREKGDVVAIKICQHVRAKREAQNLEKLMKLKHPNVVHFVNKSVVSSQLFIIMEFIDGESLKEWMRKAALSTSDLDVYDPNVQWIMTGLLSGLGVMHKQHMSHRDVKPENVMLRSERNGGEESTRVVLVDLGLSKVENVGQTKTVTETFIGTWLYFSPEQAKALSLDQRVDVWACGVILFEILMGKLPFGMMREADKLSILEKIKTTPLEDVTTMKSSLVDKFLRTALAKERYMRFRDASEMLETFELLIEKPELAKEWLEERAKVRGEQGRKRKMLFFPCRVNTSLGVAAEGQQFMDQFKAWDSGHARAFEFKPYLEPTIQHFTDEMNLAKKLDDGVLIGHFSGHSDGKGMYWHAALGEVIQVTGESLALIIKTAGVAAKFDMFYFNSCRTLQPALLLREVGVSTIVCWLDPVHDRTACEFAAHFYRLLCQTPGEYTNVFQLVCAQMSYDLKRNGSKRPCLVRPAGHGCIQGSDGVEMWRDDTMEQVPQILRDPAAVRNLGLAPKEAWPQPAQLELFTHSEENSDDEELEADEGVGGQGFSEGAEDEGDFEEEEEVSLAQKTGAVLNSADGAPLSEYDSAKMAEDASGEDEYRNWRLPNSDLDFAAIAGTFEKEMLRALNFDLKLGDFEIGTELPSGEVHGVDKKGMLT